MIDAIDVRVSYDAPVLRGATFRVESGQVAVLVGRNGAGKTTMLRVLAGLLRPDAGTVRVDGVNVVTKRREAQKRLAFLPQDTRFHGALTPRQVMRFYAGLRNRPDAPVDALLDTVALRSVADRPCAVLSGGMRQRLGLAVVQIAPVPVLLLDEPGLSLDAEWRDALRDLLRARADAGAAVLMATHYPDVWADVADVRLTCAEGTIESGDALDAPASPSNVPSTLR